MSACQGYNTMADYESSAKKFWKAMLRLSYRILRDRDQGFCNFSKTGADSACLNIL